MASVGVFCQILTLQGGVTTSAQQKLKLGLNLAKVEIRIKHSTTKGKNSNIKDKNSDTKKRKKV